MAFTTVTVSLDLRPLVARWGPVAEQAAIEVLQGDADRILADAKRGWLVRTGRSKSLLMATPVIAHGGRVLVRILDAAPYASFIHYAGSTVLIWDDLVLRPISQLKGKRLVDAIVAKIRELQQRRAA